MSTIIIKARLQHDVPFLKMCILKLYALQEEGEQALKSTTEDNGQGFNKSDALLLTSVAQDILANREPPMQGVYTLAAMRMLKYVKQLSHILTQEELEQ